MFTTDTFAFLEQLSRNNNRDWFKANLDQYESVVREPALEFIDAMGPELAKFAPHFRAEPKKVGGSLIRIYRDIRYSRDKTPYKTNIGIQFRHELGKDVHAPGFYVHLSVTDSFLAIGCWRPESIILEKFRNSILDNPEDWFAVRDNPNFAKDWTLTGDSLKNAPRGYPKDHIALIDLKRKDFIAEQPLSDNEIYSPDFHQYASEQFSKTQSFMRYLCEKLGLAY